MGRRTEKAAAGVTHNYLYDAEDIIEERISGSSADTVRYYHGVGIDEPLARKNGADDVTYYLGDHLGSIVQESNAAGGVGLEREYDPWGTALQGVSAAGYSFTGREWDTETGLSFYRARYYRADLATFASDDPIAFAGGLNFRAYVGGAPTGATDPSGLEIFPKGVPLPPKTRTPRQIYDEAGTIASNSGLTPQKHSPTTGSIWSSRRIASAASREPFTTAMAA